ncbi:MAG: sigma-70 family RNA polymerase sigma factor [Deltaproteobacteria bacterium]|nr:sigma-70 family RNA polymerase sigma factor [Deltaproteobacteria bacterium]
MQPGTLPGGDGQGRPPAAAAGPDGKPDSDVPGPAPGPAAVNSEHAAASNHAERRRAAEEDRALVERAQQGDNDAFRKLVEQHQRRAFAIAIGLVRDEHDAREIVQEAFFRVYRSLGSFKGGSSFFTWLYRIVTNLAIDLMRKPSRREAELFESPGVAEDADCFPFVSRIDGCDPLDMVRRREIAGRIQQALDELPPYHRSVIIMREVEGMSYQEMAEAMQVSKGTIMSRLFHARRKLQRALADCYREQEGREPPEQGNEP